MHIHLLSCFIMCEILWLRCLPRSKYNNCSPFKEIIDICLGMSVRLLSVALFVWAQIQSAQPEKVMMLSLQSQYFKTVLRGGKGEN